MTTDEGVPQALYKREVELAAVRQLVKRGTTPAQIEETASRLPLLGIEIGEFVGSTVGDFQ